MNIRKIPRNQPKAKFQPNLVQSIRCVLRQNMKTQTFPIHIARAHKDEKRCCRGVAKCYQQIAHERGTSEKWKMVGQ